MSGTKTKSRVEGGSKGGSGRELSVIYWNPGAGSRTCTLRVTAGKNSASVSLRDYTFVKDGTRVDVSVRNGSNRGGGVGTMDYKYSGNALQVREDAALFSIGYGVRRLRCGFLVASIHKAGTQGDALFVAHVYRTIEQRFSVAVVKVWLHGGKGFLYDLKGPARYSKLFEANQAMWKVYPSNVAITKYSSLLRVMEGVNKADKSSSKQTNTGRINNAGPVHGHMNGSIININVFFVNYLGGVK